MISRGNIDVVFVDEILNIVDNEETKKRADNDSDIYSRPRSINHHKYKCLNGCKHKENDLVHFHYSDQACSCFLVVLSDPGNEIDKGYNADWTQE